MHASMNAQFNNWLLVLLFHNSKLNIKMKCLHKGCLPIAHSDRFSFYEELLKRGFVSIHYKGLQTLAVEIFKIFKDVSPPLKTEAFPVKDLVTYVFRQVL